MPWKSVKSLEEVRREFLARWADKKKPVRTLCREFGISPKTAYKWRKRQAAGDSLRDRSRRPGKSPSATTPRMVSEILLVRAAHPTLGGKKISHMLKRKGLSGVPSGSTVTDILRQHNLLNERAVAEAPHLRRFTKSRPNEMWQVDFKGHFLLASGERCHPLNAIDDHSRYALISAPLPGETFAAVKPMFIRAFREYGLPETILCDNGNPWGVGQRNGITAFETWAMELGILVVHGRPLHPQTQGKEEGFNKSWKRECLAGLGPTPKLAEVIERTDAWRKFYNEERPHFGIGGKTPADLYEKSERPYPSKIAPWEYTSGQMVATVNCKGYIGFAGNRHFVGEGLRCKQIALEASSCRPECLNLYFREFRIGRLNLKTDSIECLRAYRVAGDPREGGGRRSGDRDGHGTAGGT